MYKRPASSILTRVVMTLVLLVLGCMFSQPAAAQSPRIVHEIIKDTKPRQSMGRDLWFAMALNYVNQGGKYYQMYVASPAKTTVHVAIGKATDQQFPINALQVLVFDIPLAWEIRGSGEVEDKAVHVYSEDADLTAYLLSRNPATSDGMYIMPSIGWGTEYVVASFASYAYLPGYELPSEMVIIANQDNTVVTINPTTDLRQGMSTAVAYPRNKPFTVTLNKGQAVQYMASAANGQMEGYDLTGTVITSTKPVGVVGAVQCANIPAENPYCDHICDMLPPTRTWAKTYYTAPYANRKGGDAILCVAKEDGTTITRSSLSGVKTHCVLNKYESYMRHDIDEASKWEGNKPFMLVQYCNSTDYPDAGSNNGIGDPNMTVVNPVEQYAPFVLFQTPKIRSAETQFRNYVNIIVHKDAINSAKFDGAPMTFPRLNIGSTDYVVYRASDIKPGAHTVESDSGVGVYIYGYGSYDSYAWTGAFGTRTFESPDRIAPEVVTPTECFCANIRFKDVHIDASKLNAIDLDTIYNFNFEIDPNWQAGTGKDSSFYDICVVDQTKEAYVKVVVYDAAGNTTTIISKYTPQVASISPPLTDFGIVTGSVPLEKKVTITNEGKTDFNISTLKLKLGNKGFKLVNPDNSPLKPGESRDITVSFLSIVPETVGDTILFGDECVLNKAVVIGNGGAPDYTVFGVDICPVLVGQTVSSDQGKPVVSSDKGIYIRNGGAGTVRIDTITLTNNADFKFDVNHPSGLNKLPIILSGDGEEREIVLTYTPLAEPGAVTDVVFHSKTPGDKIAKVTGCATAPGAEIVQNTTIDLSCVRPGDVQPYSFTIKATGSAVTPIREVRQKAGGANNTLFVNLTVIGSDNKPVVFPKNLGKSENWVVNIDFLPPPEVNGSYTTTLEVVDTFGNVIQNGVVTATANTQYRQYRYTNVPDFPAARYLSAPIDQDMTIENLTDLPIEIQRPPFPALAPGTHPTSFSVVSPTFPLTLGPRETKQITVRFDPSVSSDALQTVNLTTASTACSDTTVTIQARISVGGITAGTYPSQEVFSCASTTLDIPVTGDPNIAPRPLTWKIYGADATNWSIGIAPGMNISSNQTIDVPVTFTPVAGTLARTYQAMVDFYYTNSQGVTDTVTVPLSGVSGGIVATATSTFADKDAEAGDVVRLPIAIDIAKNIQSLDLSTADLKQVHLVYTYNTDLLSFGTQNIANSVKNTLPGWSVDGARSKETATGLDLWMTGTNSLTENDKSLGEIEFFVRLPEKDQTDEVKLESFELFGSKGETFGQCLSTSATGTQLNLVYRCGDSVYGQIMRDGKLSSIQPLTPNPITDQKVVTFRYATRVETPITIEIVDAMGNVVDRVVDNLFHTVGAYEVSYDVSKLTTGSYIYRMTAYGTKSSNRFVVTK